MARIWLPIVAVLLVVFAPALGHGQSRHRVTLRTGFVLEAERVEVDGASLVLHAGAGRIAVERSEVERIDDLPWVMPPSDESAPPAPFAESPTVKQLLRLSATKHGLPEAFVASVAEAESALQPRALSPKGARGVMQLMPGTAAALGVNPDEPAENIDGGAKLLRDLLLRYQHHPDQVRLALAAYNAGAGAVAKHGGIPPYRETNTYVERVLRRYRAKQTAAAATTRASQSGSESGKAQPGATQR
ncbi:MAG: lytic transglycosylase domain-containing protein [Bryobacterales bacterium]|nr:lytic transglycosylase domain-containing protein [Bryobacterales bacterium]